MWSDAFVWISISCKTSKTGKLWSNCWWMPWLINCDLWFLASDQLAKLVKISWIWCRWGLNMFILFAALFFLHTLRKSCMGGFVMSSTFLGWFWFGEKKIVSAYRMVERILKWTTRYWWLLWTWAPLMYVLAIFYEIQMGKDR